jgi:hypothetical protein
MRGRKSSNRRARVVSARELDRPTFLERDAVWGKPKTTHYAFAIARFALHP